MSVDRMRRLFAYNQWAWDRVFPQVEQLSDFRGLFWIGDRFGDLCTVPWSTA